MSDSFHDEELARLYRDAPKAGPPPALDAAILAAARREVGAGPRRDFLPDRMQSFRQWRVPLSVAAVVVISGSLVFLAERERPVDSEYFSAPAEQGAVQPALRAKEARESKDPVGATAQSPVSPAPPQAVTGPVLKQLQKEPVKRQAARTESPAMPKDGETSAAAAEMPENRVNAGSAAGRLDSGATNQPPAAKQSMPAAAMPRIQGYRPAEPAAAFAPLPSQPAAQPAPVAKPEGFVYRLRRDANGPQSLGIRGSAGGSPGSADIGAAAKADAAADSPEAWLARIEALRREGKPEEAQRSLAEFRKRYPDYPLPAHLKTP